MSRHFHTLFITVHMFGMPVSMVMVDNGAAVNMMPISTIAKLNRTYENIAKTGVTITNFKDVVIGTQGVLSIDIQVWSSVTTSAFFVVGVSELRPTNSRGSMNPRWRTEQAKLLGVSPRPFSINFLAPDARCYDESVGLVHVMGQDLHGRST
ncbi:hypothetical protein CRG98_044622 [Punica granatum]|uniref:Uncharacterized protein n=1 Tax=Punica granatum TaxID=22663 RepID=A0A2I0HTE8_PUNGR|nr:hypothetical protein CRG98_044622 [Punica granatum]